MFDHQDYPLANLTAEELKAAAALTLELLDRLPGSLPLEERLEHIHAMIDQSAEAEPSL